MYQSATGLLASEIDDDERQSQNQDLYLGVGLNQSYVYDDASES